jgi:uncharacterized protein YndB with AHSA1/START domain
LTEISATVTVRAGPEQVFAFLADLENHWRLTGRRIEVVSLEGPPGARRGGVVRMHGPLRVRRTATTRVLEAEPPSGMKGEAKLGNTTLAAVSWQLQPVAAGTEVTLSARVLEATVVDSLLLALGGRAWLRRLFGSTLRRLDGALARHAVDPTEPDDRAEPVPDPG